MIPKRVIATTFLIVLAFGLIFWIAPVKTAAMCLGIALFAASYFWLLAVKQPGAKHDDVKLGRLMPSLLSILLLIIPLLVCGVLASHGVFGKVTVVLVVLLVSLAASFFTFLLTIPLALRQKHLEAQSRTRPMHSFPRVTAIVPAHNEEDCLGQTIDALLESDYPYKEIIVVDDGSTDRTYAIATGYEGAGVTVLRRPNGGKAAALNYGLLFARGEIVVTIDADSLVSRRALTEMVRCFEDWRVSAVAGNVKVLNRRSILTNCQALEYIVGINIFRRALDVFGSVPVVPGCLGAFRKEVLEEVGFYDPCTLTEDFDSTVKVLKAEGVVQACDARVDTQAPETLMDLYRQRLRWYRGNLQTVVKHKDAFTNRRFGCLHFLAFPFLIYSLTLVPLAGIMVVVSSTMMVLDGNGMQVLSIFAFFVLLQALLSALAIQLENEDMKLVIYSPFLVVGYRLLIDLVMFRSVFDVVTQRKVGWTSARRVAFGIGKSPEEVWQ